MTQLQKSPGALFIVGAGPGIGEATAEQFGCNGWTIVLSSRNPKNLDPLVARLSNKGIKAHGIVLDATKADDLRAAMRQADDLSDGLTAVLYNAANVRQQDLSSMSDADINGDVAVNITAGFHTIRTAIDLFQGREGTILVTGGGLAVSPHASYAGLGAGKAALRNFVEGLAPELSARKIRIAIATIATLVSPNSAEAKGVAETFWMLATEEQPQWEMVYPSAAQAF